MSYGPSDRAAVLAARLIARDGVRWRDALESVTLECGERPSDGSPRNCGAGTRRSIPTHTAAPCGESEMRRSP